MNRRNEATAKRAAVPAAYNWSGAAAAKPARSALRSLAVPKSAPIGPLATSGGYPAPLVRPLSWSGLHVPQKAPPLCCPPPQQPARRSAGGGGCTGAVLISAAPGSKGDSSRGSDAPVRRRHGVRRHVLTDSVRGTCGMQAQ